MKHMFEKKQYYISKFSLANRYCVELEFESESKYEKQFLTKDEQGNRNVLVFEKIGTSFPDFSQLKNFDRRYQYHSSIIFPVDFIQKSNVYVHENEIGFVYPENLLKCQTFAKAMDTDKAGKVKNLRALLECLEKLNRFGIYFSGFDKRQLVLENEKVKILYDGFDNGYRNSLYRIPDYCKSVYKKSPWILDAFSMAVILFESMYDWHPFFGSLMAFSAEEEYRFEVFYNNFKDGLFIFDKLNDSNQIGFLVEQQEIIKKWEATDIEIRQFFEDIFSMNIPDFYPYDVLLAKIQTVITYYEETMLFQ